MMDELLKKLWYAHTTEHHAAIKWNYVVIYKLDKTWRLNEVSQKEKEIPEILI